MFMELLHTPLGLMKIKISLLAIVLAAWCATASAETPEEWIALGARVHGAFGSFIPLGIKIGTRCCHPPQCQAARVDGPVLRQQFVAMRLLCRRSRYSDLRFRRSAHSEHRARESTARNGCGGHHSPTSRRGWFQIYDSCDGSDEARADEQGPGPAWALRCSDGDRWTISGRGYSIIRLSWRPRLPATVARMPQLPE